MSGYTPNGRDDPFSGRQYVNFDQFLVQHNISSAPQSFYTPAQNGYYGDVSQFSSPSAHSSAYQAVSQRPLPFPPPPPEPTHQLVQNSNLMPTAKEFVPNTSSPSASADNVQNFTSGANGKSDSLPLSDSNARDRNSNRRNRSNRSDGHRNELDRSDSNKNANVDRSRNYDRLNQNRRNERGNLRHAFKAEFINQNSRLSFR